MRSRYFVFAGLLFALVFMLWTASPTYASPHNDKSPNAITSYKIYVVRRGDTLSHIALRFGVSIRTLMKVNHIRNANRIYAGQRLRIPVSGSSGGSSGGGGSASGSYKIYTIRRGDTLSGIAARFGVSVRTLQRVNHIRNPRLIYAGSRLRIPSRGAATSPPPSGGGGGATSSASKWIEIDLSRHRLWAHQNNKVVFTTLVSTGIPGRRTPIGRFHVWAKIRRQTMSGPGYRLPNVQWVMYFAGENAIHGTYWHHNFGHPMSHGCVNVTNSAAKWLYNWSPSHVLVVVHQ